MHKLLAELQIMLPGEQSHFKEHKYPQQKAQSADV